MKKIIGFQPFYLLGSCKEPERPNILRVGDVYAKNIVGLTIGFQNGKENLNYSWSIAPSPTGEWSKL